MSEWTLYMERRAPRVLCQFRRVSTGETFVANSKDFHQMFDVGGLEWKLTGIGREELELLRESPEGTPVYEGHLVENLFGPEFKWWDSGLGYTWKQDSLSDLRSL